MYKYLLKAETAPRCNTCDQMHTVKHILIYCKIYKKKTRSATNTLMYKTIPFFFKNVSVSQIPKRNRLLPTLIEQSTIHLIIYKLYI